MIGEVLSGRYEILSRIGGGGMALVYKALDRYLNRYVAVKVLRQQFVGDEEFIRRFRREAQSAASLSHPNIVSVYDVGQQGDTPFIVMELVEGTNLNDKIKEQAPLQVEEAVRIASQICDALDHAHSNQIIHRDIKPHNILIGKNGRVKVTDFGIARAATSSDITQTGSVIGSVHYFSPEHAKGVSQGEKSDIYSLGVVLYQMLTAQLPFLGESPISVALKHLQEDVKEPREVNKLIPQSVENIILKSMRKNPDDRYDSAKEMLQDLETCLLPERLHEPKIRFPEVDEPTLIMPAIRGSAKDRAEEGDREESDETPRRRFRWIGFTVWTVVLLALLAGAGYGIGYVKEQLRPPVVTVPDVTGVPLADAQKKLTDAKLAANVTYQNNDTVPKDSVIKQDVDAGEKVREASLVTLTVSKGPEPLTLDNYVGKQQNDAKLALQALLSPDRVKIVPQYSDKPEGEVIDQSPAAGDQVDPAKATVTLTVSQGEGTVNMPNVIGDTEEVAKTILTVKNNFNVTVATGTSFMQKGLVYKQWPYEPNAKVKPGSDITIFVSTGYPPDAVEGLKSVTVHPSAPGVKTKIQVLVSDARGENQVWDTREISDDKVFPIDVVLSNDTQTGVITVKENDETVQDTITFTYQELKNAQEPFQPVGPYSAGEGGTDANASNGTAGPGTDAGTGGGSTTAP